MRRAAAICLLLILASVAVGCLVGCESQEQIQRSSVAGSSVRYYVTAEELYEAYDENEIAADEKYKGEVVQVTGVVDDISEDILGQAYVTLQGDEYGFNSVQCFFPDSARASLSRLRKGQTVRVKGVCDGFSILNVLVKGCELR